MRAVTLPSFGGPEVLTVADVPDPQIGAGEVLVDVVATAVNRADTLQRMGSDVPDHMAYAVELVEGVTANADRIDELIASYAEGWTLDRMPVVDRNLGRIGVYEIVFRDDIDDAVALSEVVELADELSTDGSARFLNGLLDRIREYATR